MLACALCMFSKGIPNRPSKRGDMGPLSVLVSPCFKEKVVVTCKIGSFLCSLDSLLQKNVGLNIVFFFGNQISEWRSFEKRAIFDLLFTFFSHQGKVTKIPSANISHIYITKWWAKLKLGCLLLICIYTNAKFIVNCKHRTLNDGRWRLSSIQKTQNGLLLSSSHFAFYR